MKKILCLIFPFYKSLLLENKKQKNDILALKDDVEYLKSRLKAYDKRLEYLDFKYFEFNSNIDTCYEKILDDFSN